MFAISSEVFNKITHLPRAQKYYTPHSFILKLIKKPKFSVTKIRMANVRYNCIAFVTSRRDRARARDKQRRCARTFYRARR